MPVAPVEHPHISTSRPPQSRGMLGLRAYSRIILLLLGAAAALVVTAGTWRYWEAAAWLTGVFATLGIATAVLLTRDPQALEYRLGMGRRKAERQIRTRWFAPIFVLAFLVPGLDFRFGWSDGDVETVPRWLALAADGIVVLAIVFACYVALLTARVRRLRPQDSRVALLSTGPYHVIRHPLFAASLVAWMATPIALGSWVAIPAFLLVLPYYVVQLRTEERQLAKELPGYAAYCRRTPFRLIPFVW